MVGLTSLFKDLVYYLNEAWLLSIYCMNKTADSLSNTVMVLLNPSSEEEEDGTVPLEQTQSPVQE